MNNKTTFYLARHGQTEWNVERRIQGQLDSFLTPEGQQQASQLAGQCRELNITQVLTSSLGRAVQTANICAQQLNITVKSVSGFEERHFGLWQGKLVSEVNDDVHYNEITSQITDCKPEQGESAKELLARFTKALTNQLQTENNETFLIVSHGDILRSFMAQFEEPLSSEASLSDASLSEAALSETSLSKTSSKKALSTGYDYKNAQLIAMSYDQTTGKFSKL